MGDVKVKVNLAMDNHSVPASLDKKTFFFC
jgi:hypothetical protein